MIDDPPANAIETDNLRKTYAGGVVALKGVSLAVPRGSFFGLLGPNGAGKSTLINILAGLAVKSGGTARIWGHDIDRQERRARAAIGVVPQEINIDPFFSPFELLELQAGFYGVPRRRRRTGAILEAMGLADKAGAYTRTLSGGMKRRLLVAKALVHDPPVLILDEPTAGVDIDLRQQLWDYVRHLNDQGITIVLTTHYLEEAEALCDRIAIIDHGDIIAEDTTHGLVGRLDNKTLTLVLDRDLDAVPGTLTPYNAELRDPRHLVVRYRPSETAIGTILEAANGAGLTIADLTTEEADLEDIFLQLTRASGAP